LAIKKIESKFLVASYIFGDLIEFGVAFAEFYHIFRVFFAIWRLKKRSKIGKCNLFGGFQSPKMRETDCNI
jgi:hypothetical protein